MYIKYKFVTGEKVYVEVVDIKIYEYHIENYWQEDWRERKNDKESSFEEIYSMYERCGLPQELQEQSSEDSYITRCQYEKLYKAINLLPKTQRRRIILKYFHNLTIKEIAELEKISPQTVKEGLSKAKSQIKKYVEKFFE